MPPAAKKDCGLILFDVGSCRKRELLSALLKFATYKWFMNSRSIYRLILVNSAQTKNDKDYPNIYTTDVDDFDPKIVSKKIEEMKSGKCNWINALQLGIYHLTEAVEMRGLITLQLIFFTTLDDTFVPSLEDIDLKSIIEPLNKYDMFLYIIGPNINLPFAITNENSVSKCMKELQVDQTQKNLIIAHRIVTGTNKSVMCNTKIGIHLLVIFKNPQGSQPWRVPMTFGTKLTIPTDTCKIYRKDLCLRLCSPLPRNYIKTLADNRSVKVEEVDIVRGLIRHGKFIKMDDLQFRVESQKCFSIFGFTDKKYVPETYFRGEDTFYVIPTDTNNDGFQFFTHLVNILYETGKYAIGKRVHFTNNKVRYFVLIPKVDYNPKCFIMTGLPHAGFLVPHKSETPLQPKEKIKQDDFMRFFKSLIVENKDSKAGVSLGPAMMMDFHQQKLIDLTTKKYSKREDLDFESLDICDHESIVDNKFLESLKHSWPIRNLDSTKH